MGWGRAVALALLLLRQERPGRSALTAVGILVPKKIRTDFLLPSSAKEASTRVAYQASFSVPAFGFSVVIAVGEVVVALIMGH